VLQRLDRTEQARRRIRRRDHVDFIRKAVARLAPRGLLLFSNNFRRFRLDSEALGDLAVEDVSATTIPKDFARDPKVHGCYEIRALRLGLERKSEAVR
jgi:23S rRNA (guanine2445-N2)-methyltransferase / 23S rRNA (guanine2069-N7)-methyltransferase